MPCQATDKGHVSAEREAAFAAPGKVWGAMRKAPKGGVLHPIDERINRVIAMVRAKVEHPFRVLKRKFGHVKTRYRGLAKNRAQLFTLFGQWVNGYEEVAARGLVRHPLPDR